MKYKKFIETDEKAPIYAKRIASLLNKRGLTQGDLAKLSGVSAPTISDWVQGKKDGTYTEPKICGLNDVARALNVSVDYLIGNTNIKQQNIEMKNVERYTGLSENAITVLNKFKAENRHTSYSDILSTLIEDMEGGYVLDLIGKSISYYAEKKELKKNEIVKNMIQRTLHIDIDGSNLTVYKDSLIESILQTEFIKSIPLIADRYLENYSDTPSQRKDKWNEFSQKYADKVKAGEITFEEYQELIKKWLDGTIKEEL